MYVRVETSNFNNIVFLLFDSGISIRWVLGKNRPEKTLFQKSRLSVRKKVRIAV